MKILKFFLHVISVFIAALLGNWIGERWRTLDTGEPGHELTAIHTNDEGEVYVAINPLLTNFVPAVILGLLTRPGGWILAFVTGVITARFMGDKYEEQFDEFVRGLIPEGSREVGEEISTLEELSIQ